jgi:hypothetical protein
VTGLLLLLGVGYILVSLGFRFGRFLYETWEWVNGRG